MDLWYVLLVLPLRHVARFCNLMFFGSLARPDAEHHAPADPVLTLYLRKTHGMSWWDCVLKGEVDIIFHVLVLSVRL